MVEQSTLAPSTLALWQSVDELNKQAAALQFKNPGQARSFAEQALALAQSAQEIDFTHQAETGKSLTILSRCAVEVADYPLAIDCGLQAIAIGEKVPSTVGRRYHGS